MSGLISGLRLYPSLEGIIIASGGQMGISDALEDSEIKLHLAGQNHAKRPYVVSCDLTSESRHMLEADLADFVIDQDGFSQGYRVVRTLTRLLDGEEGPGFWEMYTKIVIRSKYTS